VAEIRHIERMNQNRLTLREAASLMQIGRQRVRELIDADVLHTWIDRRRVSASTWWLSKADVLHVATIGRTADRSVADYAWIDLALVLKTWRLRRGEFPALVRALLAEEVRARRPTEYATGLGHIELPVGELKTWLRSRRQEGTSSLSVDEAAKRLGLKQQVAYELVERGLIPVSGPRGARRVDPKGIDAFRRTYISLAELAKSQSVSPRGLLAILPNQPICGPSIDGARQYFYRRDEVARFQGLPFVP
jgi:excisionase family DNA binding protein